MDAGQRPDGPAASPTGRASLLAALRFLQLQGRIRLVEEAADGGREAPPA